MAGDWIKFEHATPDKPEVFKMSALLNIDPDAVVGKLVRFWSWCDQQTLDGNDLGVPDTVIDRVTHQPGFSAALRKVSWLQARSGSLAIPNFDRHNGQTAKARGLANKRKDTQRDRDKSHAPSVTETGTREEKRRPEKTIDPSIPPPPPAAADDSKDPRHYQISAQWSRRYSLAFGGSTYVASGRDWGTLKRFLTVCKDDAETVLTVAVQAWERSREDRFAKHCKEAATLHGLCDRYNEIRAELRTPLGHAAQPNPPTRFEV